MKFSFQKPSENRPQRGETVRYVLVGNTPVQISSSQYIAEKHELIEVSATKNANGQYAYTYKRKKKGA